MLTVKALKNILKTLPTKHSMVLVEDSNGDLFNCHMTYVEDPITPGQMAAVFKIDDNGTGSIKKTANCEFTRVETGEKYVPDPARTGILVTGIKPPEDVL